MYRLSLGQSVCWKTLCVSIVAVVALLVPAVHLQGKEITDIFGRKFSVADKPKKVYSPSPPMTSLLCAVDPTVLAGLNNVLRGNERKYMPKQARSLPVLGGWFGQGNVPNMEMVLRANPEMVILQDLSSISSPNLTTNRAILKTVPAPVVSIGMSTLSEYPEAILSLGRLLGREERTRELAAYTRQTLTDLKAFARGIPDRERVSVYYAEGIKGLNTECDTSIRSEIIHLAGGRNVHRCDSGRSPSGYGMERVDLEQVLFYDPDVIIVFEKTFYRNVFSDPLWQRIKAVRNRRVYLIPNEPFGWTDRPPSFMRFLGVKWLANILHPVRYRIDMVRETQRFFKLFFGVRLTVDEARGILLR